MTGTMTFQQARDYLYSLERFGWKLGLERILQLLDDLGGPQRDCRFIHIAGTNGKGSVAAMLESVFRNAGYKTGLYTSPHLVDVRERVRVNGEMISEHDFAAIMGELVTLCEKTPATFFEVMTALAFAYFSRQQADLVILETGLGGRFDATNVVTPLLSVITSIDLEHTEHLGPDLASIAFEKAGIVKPGVPCVIGDLQPEATEVIERICNEKQAPLYRYQDVAGVLKYEISKHGTNIVINIGEQGKISAKLPLTGPHQALNAAIAVSAVRITAPRISMETIQRGLEKVQWEGRFQFLRRDPPVIMDVAHNTASVAGLVRVLNELYPEYKKHFIMGLLSDKDVHSICRELAPVAESVMLVTLETSRAMDVEILRKEFGLYNVPVEILPSLAYGLETVLNDKSSDKLYCITGSHYIAGEIKALLIKNLTS